MTTAVSVQHPPAPPDLAELMRSIVEFVSEYQWVYDVQITRFFELSWWEKIPKEWHEALLQLSPSEINQLPSHLTKAEWPSSLKDFVALSSGRLSLDRRVPEWVQGTAVEVEKSIQRGMTPKKLHEVSCLAGVVQHVCQKAGCEVVLDIGSGLGYLGQCLSEQCGLMVISVEREESRVASAMKRSKYSVPKSPAAVVHSDSCRDPTHRTEEVLEGQVVQQAHLEVLKALPKGHVFPCHVTVELDISEDQQSWGTLARLLDELQGQCECSFKVCMVGLHCCGDLTPAMLKLFSSHVHPSLSSLVVVSCCYHKMSRRDPHSELCEFSSFPLSDHLKGILATQQRERKDFFLNVFAMRLAAQETRQRWRAQSPEDHAAHEKHVAFRGMLEAVYKGKSLPKEILRAKHQTIEEYAENISRRLSDLKLRDELLKYHFIHSRYIPYIEPFTALQVCMQGVLESLVLIDRLMFLQENRLTSEVIPVFDEEISPRNLAILALL